MENLFGSGSALVGFSRAAGRRREQDARRQDRGDQTGGIVGPGLLACKGPKYKVVTVPAEGLFQGALDEMRRDDKSVDPLKMAAKVGFRGTSWKSLQTGCANELDFHFVDPNTAEFGLNNYVYILKKQ